jgi:uncharacterized protein YjbK
MSTKLEIESKFELDVEGFERLRQSGRIARCEEQLNIYYDFDWHLAETSSTFRIRFRSGDVPVLTFKVPVSVADGRRVMREYELPLTEGELRQQLRCSTATRIDVGAQLPAEIRDHLLQLGIVVLRRMGWMRNARFVVDIEGVGAIELDRTLLPNGRVVYEAEVECEDERIHESLCHFIRIAAPTAKPSGVSKFQRFRTAIA